MLFINYAHQGACQWLPTWDSTNVTYSCQPGNKSQVQVSYFTCIVTGNNIMTNEKIKEFINLSG